MDDLTPPDTARLREIARAHPWWTARAGVRRAADWIDAVLAAAGEPQPEAIAYPCAVAGCPNRGTYWLGGDRGYVCADHRPSGEPQPPADAEFEPTREALEALPLWTVVAVGKRLPSGGWNPCHYMRTGDGLRSVAPRRDDDDRMTLYNQSRQNDVAAIRAVPVAAGAAPSTPQADDTYEQWSIRDANGDSGDMYGWWPLENALQMLGRRRSHHAQHGPYELIHRSWTASDEVVPAPSVPVDPECSGRHIAPWEGPAGEPTPDPGAES